MSEKDKENEKIVKETIRWFKLVSDYVEKQEENE